MDLKDCRCSHDSLKKLIQNSSKNKKKPLTPQEEKKWDKIIKKYDTIIEDLQNELDGKDPVSRKDQKSDNYILEGKNGNKYHDDSSDGGYGDGDRDNEMGDLAKGKQKEWDEREARLDDDLRDINGVLDEIKDMALGIFFLV